MVHVVELRHLRYFVTLCEELHFGRAAQRLHMAQPPLSQRIKDLERELGVQLFDRTSHRVRLTEAGALLLEHARPVLASADTAREAMRRIRPGTSGLLRVGVPPDTAPRTLSTLVARFSELIPDVLLDLHELTTDEQLTRLREGKLDAAVVRHPADTVGLESGPVVDTPLGIVLATSNPLAGADEVRLRDLAEHPLVIFPREMAPRLYDHILAICRDNGFLPSAIRHARNPNFVHGLVLAGRGVHLNQQPSSELTGGLTWRPVDEHRLTWSTSVVWIPTQHTDVIDAFARATLEALRTPRTPR